MSRRYKLLIVAPYFPPHPGGLEYFALNIAQQLDKNHNWEVVVVTTAEQHAPYAEERLGKIKVYRLPYHRKISNTPLSLRWFGRLRSIIKAEQPDIINVHAPVPGLADIAAIVAGRVPVVVNYHSGSMKKDRWTTDTAIWLYEHIVMPKMMRTARRIICSSDYVRDGLLARYKSKSQTITPAADQKLFYPAKTKPATASLLFVGSLNHADSYKGLDYLLDAFTRLKTKFPKLKLVVVGEGDKRPYYEARCKELGIDSFVTFTGRLEGTKLVEAYRKASIFVLPSSHDSFPMVIAEAMASRLPVVSTTVGGIPTAVDDGVTGLLVPPNDAKALTASIRRLLKNTTLAKKLGAAGRRKTLDKLTWETQAKLTNTQLLQVLRPRIVQVAAYYTPHLGGLERVVEAVSEQLADDGYKVEVIASDIGRGQAPRLVNKDLMTIRRLRSFEFAHIAFMPGLFWRLWRTPKPVIFHLHLGQAYVPELVWLVAKLRRVPYVVHFHLDVERSGRLGFLFVIYKRTIQPLIMRDASHIIALSEDQSALIARNYHRTSNDISFIPNGVSERFLAIGSKTRRAHHPLRLLFVGRFTIQKRVDRLIEALKDVKDPVHLDIVGDGEDMVALEQQVKALRLKNITFHGSLGRDALATRYAQADVFVLPSDKEGMPLVMLEAMAAGLPVIGSDVQGIREHLKNVGILVKNPSPKNFAKAINNFNGKRKTLFGELSKASRAQALRYKWPALVKRMESIYQTVQPNIIRTRTVHSPEKKKLIGGVVLWWLSFLVLRVIPGMPAPIIDTVGFSFLMFVPGGLTVHNLPLKKLEPWGKLVLSVGFSVLELMAVTLLGNTVLQWFGVTRPLDTPFIIAYVSLLVVALCIITWRKSGLTELHMGSKLRELFPSKLDVVLSFTPLLFVGLSILGTISLNNGGTNAWTMVMLIGMAAYSTVLAYYSKAVGKNAIPTALFFMALSLLLMTSLRGWYTTGHDIQREYRVFLLAKDNGIWSIDRFRDAYNACASITVLPTTLFNLLKVNDVYVYKIFFQIIFAVVPVAVYLLVRQYTSRLIAFLSVFYFVAFPTFFSDMPFLNRQEVAFLFLALMLFVIFNKSIKLPIRRALFLLLGTGMIISHYSTTYSVLAILIFVLLLKPVIKFCAQRLRKRKVFQNSGVNVLSSTYLEEPKQAITIVMVVTLVLLGLLWTNVLTKTSNQATTVISQTISSITGGFKEDAKSGDASYNIFSWHKTDPQQELSSYESRAVATSRKNSDSSAYYPPNITKQYSLHIVTTNISPLTKLGNFFSHLGIDVASFNYNFRQASAKILQILVILGFIYVMLRRKFNRPLNLEFVALAIASLLFVVLQVVLPFLSVNYGLLRAFQQSLMVLGVFVVIGSFAMGALFRNKTIAYVLPVGLAVIFFLSLTGVIPELLGGYSPQLHLNNAGTYYDIYYLHKSEILGINYLSRAVSQKSSTDQVQSEIQTDRYTLNRVRTYTDIPAQNDIIPSLVRRDSYVYLGSTNVRKGQATTSYNGDLLTYYYPLNFLNDNKNLIYNNGGSRVYR